MTMCAAITVPIIKDGYRLYPGMPVSSSGGQQIQGTSTTHRYYRDPNMVINNRGQANSQTLYFTRQSSCNNYGAGMSSSPPDGGGPVAASPPGRNGGGNNGNGHGATVRQGGHAGAGGNRIIVGGATGGHQVVLLQPRTRTTSNQSQMSARSSFEVGPTQMNYWTDQAANRTAMSTSQLYIQKRRELCIQQQLAKQQQQLQQQQLQQQQQQQQPSDSINSNLVGSVSTSVVADEQRKRKPSSQGDPNNNSDSESSNPFRKFLRRLGFGSSPSTSSTPSTISHTRHVSFESPIIGSDCESGIEQAISASETGVAVSAWH